MCWKYTKKAVQVSGIGILDITRVSKTNFTVNLDKNSDAYKNMTQKEFAKVLRKMTNDQKTDVAMCIAKTIHKFVQDGKTMIKIPHHFE